MVARLPGAILRALLVALLASMPALILPPQQAATMEIVLLLAVLGGALTFFEYTSRYPSLVEFRDAPPANRLRFACLFAMVLVVTLIVSHSMAPGALSSVAYRCGAWVGGYLDFPLSPVRLAVRMLPAGQDPAITETVRNASGLVYLICLTTVAWFLVAVRLGGWPSNSGAFNVWINLPLFDPTAGGDVIQRLQRDGRVNIVLGGLLPFVIPVAVRLATPILDAGVITSPNVLIWLLSALGFLPASMIMRGIALLRVAVLIKIKRRQVIQEAREPQIA